MEIKTMYLPISIKRQICATIKINSLIEENGMFVLDNISKTLATDMSLLQFYCQENIDNINMDELYESGEMEKIRKSLPESELNFIDENSYNMICQEQEINNSLSGIINRQLTNLISKLPDEKSMSKLLNKLPKALEKISPETIDLLKNISSGKIK